ncbi:MAG: hypothetical protein ACYC1Y_00020 [Minisyncoccota bacterium]
MNFWEILGTLGIGGFAGTVVQQMLSNSHDSKVKRYETKKEAYISAAATISGFGHASAHRLLTNLDSNRSVNETDLVQYRSELSRGMASATLVGSENLRIKMREADKLILELKELVNKALKSKNEEIAKNFREKRDELIKWEDEVIVLMRKELEGD